MKTNAKSFLTLMDLLAFMALILMFLCSALLFFKAFSEMAEAQCIEGTGSCGVGIETPSVSQEVIPAPPIINNDGSIPGPFVLVPETNELFNSLCPNNYGVEKQNLRSEQDQYNRCVGVLNDVCKERLGFECATPLKNLFDPFLQGIPFFDVASCEAHLESAKLSVFQQQLHRLSCWDTIELILRGTKPQTETPEVVASNDCTEIKDIRDGSGGWLWKHVSESTGRVVLLTPKSFCGKINDVKVLAADGSEAASASRRTSADCKANGNRGHYDLSKSAKQLADVDPLTVKLILDSGEVVCRSVENAGVRND